MSKRQLMFVFLLLFSLITMGAMPQVSGEGLTLLNDLTINFPDSVPGVIHKAPDSQGAEKYDGGAIVREVDYQAVEIFAPFSWKQGKAVENISLYIGPTNSPYEIFLNGEMVHRWGFLPPNPVTTNFASIAVPLPSDKLKGNNVLAVRFYMADDVLFPPLLVSSAREVGTAVFWRNFVGVYLIRGAAFAALLISIYLMMLFLGSRDFKHLWFALFSFFFVFAYLEIAFCYESTNELLFKKLSKDGFILAVVFFTFFVLDFVEIKKLRKNIMGGLGFIALIFLVWNMSQPNKQGVDVVLGYAMPFYLGPLLLINSFLVLKFAIIRHSKESIILSFSFLMLLGASFSDIAHIMQGLIPYSYLTAYGFISVVIGLFSIITIEQLKTSRQNAAWAKEAEKTSAERQHMLEDISRVVDGLSKTGIDLGVQLDRSEQSVSRSMDNAETFGTSIVTSLESIEGSLTTAFSHLDESSRKIPSALAGLSSFSETMTSSVSSMKQEVDEVVQGASATGASADQFSNIAREGVDVVSQTSRAMTKISENSVFLTELLTAVEDIAGQMSILSINASIEAARAGTYGEGFAVVAQEVRKLADQANRQLASSFEQIEQMQKAVTKGADLSNQLSGSLETILAEAEQTAVRIRGMLTKLESQQNHTTKLMTSALEMSEDIRAVKDLSDISNEENVRLAEAIGGVSNTLGEVGSLLANQQEDTGELRTAVKELGDLGRQNLSFVESLKEVVKED